MILERSILRCKIRNDFTCLISLKLLYCVGIENLFKAILPLRLRYFELAQLPCSNFGDHNRHLAQFLSSFTTLESLALSLTSRFRRAFGEYGFFEAWKADQSCLQGAIMGHKSLKNFCLHSKTYDSGGIACEHERPQQNFLDVYGNRMLQFVGISGFHVSLPKCCREAHLTSDRELRILKFFLCVTRVFCISEASLCYSRGTSRIKLPQIWRDLCSLFLGPLLSESSPLVASPIRRVSLSIAGPPAFSTEMSSVWDRMLSVV